MFRVAYESSTVYQGLRLLYPRLRGVCMFYSMCIFQQNIKWCEKNFRGNILYLKSLKRFVNQSNAIGKRDWEERKRKWENIIIVMREELNVQNFGQFERWKISIELFYRMQGVYYKTFDIE